MSLLKRVMLLTLGACLFSSCTTLKPHRVIADFPPNETGRLPVQPGFLPADSRECDLAGDNCVHIIEYDEFGNVFNRNQLNAAVAAAKSVAEEHGSVIVYVHGWHHSAKPGDSDITNFRATVDQSAKRTKRKTIGVYVAWRGDSINSNNSILAFPSYAFTFWNRKSTAHSVGNGGGVSELFRKLSAIKADNYYSQFLIVGHSFGGAIVYSAVSQLLAEQISIDSNFEQDSLVSNDRNGNRFYPIADLVVLINPALEAMKLKPLYSLARSQDYRLGLPPRLVIITSTADWATHLTFPLGRVLGSINKGYPDKESRALNKTAIGHYEPYITHQLAEGECSSESMVNSLLHLRYEDEFRNNKKQLCLEGVNPEKSLILTRCDEPNDCAKVTNGHYLVRGPSDKGYIPVRFPIANIRTNETMVTGHSDIWGPKLKVFLLGLLEVAINNPQVLPVVVEDVDPTSSE